MRVMFMGSPARVEKAEVVSLACTCIWLTSLIGTTAECVVMDGIEEGASNRAGYRGFSTILTRRQVE